MPRISYVPLDQMDDEMRVEMDRCAQHGTPRPESSAVRAHCPDDLQDLHGLLGRHLPQGRAGPRHQGARAPLHLPHHQLPVLRQPALVDERACPSTPYDELLNFEKSDRYDDRQKAALAYAQAIAWNESDLDGLWSRMHEHFSEEELVELGCFVALTFGQQSWIRLIEVGHHEYMPGTSAGIAPGFEAAEATT